MGRVIKANLSVKSITDAIEQIRKYQEELDSKVKEFTKRLAEEGVQIAKANVVDLQYLRVNFLEVYQVKKDLLVKIHLFTLLRQIQTMRYM